MNTVRLQAREQQGIHDKNIRFPWSGNLKRIRFKKSCSATGATPHLDGTTVRSRLLEGGVAMKFYARLAYFTVPGMSFFVGMIGPYWCEFI